ncbi:glycosyltransferase family 39 protein [Legionella shakespearei]|uniref:Dolichyl-phosphate mannosyltransferase n=1 Tax=Legionella shakespearei DSM 23087 TaxID=1122169 RepID=A0A0W0Z1C8_9GAMM|nr:glycosyltransferase family 39 protein [Legionella shakespearei]KTD62671.1 dolichyl-phosphate mannosyltransferase [Legionella shakespearei DSM 23087]
MQETQSGTFNNLKKINCYFWLFVILHTLLWTLGPALIRPTLPHDTLEGITWGLQWQLGYNKHPFLTAWLCAGVTQLFGTVGWPVYLLAQLAVSATFIAVWQLAKQVLPAMHALIATLVLEGVFFYNINSFNFTPDTLQSPLWALLGLFFYQALVTQKIRNWLYTALFAALCVCTKYQVAILLLPMFLLCLLDNTARKSFYKPGMYWALLLFIALISPHLVWLYQHDFITLTYAEKVSSEYTQNKSIWNHVLYPVRFFINNIIQVIGLFILLWPFYDTKNKNKQLRLDHFSWHFLIAVGLGPVLLSLLLCFLSGDYFPPRWATPYFFALGIIVIACLKPVFTKESLTYFAITLILFSSLLFGIRMVTLSVYPRPTSDAFLPNQKIALSLAQLWQERYKAPLPYIAGSNYLVALITPYLSDKPLPYLSWSQAISPWINEEDLRTRGGIFVWDEGQNYAWDEDSKHFAFIPESVWSRFPELKRLPDYTFYRSSDNAPIIIGVAILPPKASDA